MEHELSSRCVAIRVRHSVAERLTRCILGCIHTSADTQIRIYDGDTRSHWQSWYRSTVIDNVRKTGGGGFSSFAKIFWDCSTIHSPPLGCCCCFFCNVEMSSRTLTPHFMSQDESTVAQRTELTVADHGGRIFFSRVNFVCWLLFGVHSTPVLPQWHIKGPVILPKLQVAGYT